MPSFRSLAIIFAIAGTVFYAVGQNLAAPHPKRANPGVLTRMQNGMAVVPTPAPDAPSLPAGKHGRKLDVVGLPVADCPVTVLHRIGYSAGYSTRVFCPLWTTYFVKPVTAPKSEARPEAFTPDPDMPPEYQVDTKEYARSGYDRGHMAPNWAISISYGREAQIQTFYTTNVIPQNHILNRGLWEELEKIEANDYARRYNGVMVFNGPIFNATSTKTIGQSHPIRVPSYCYKIILRFHRGQIDALAFVFPQKAYGQGRACLERYLTSIAAIEQATGVHFLTGLPADEQAVLKAKTARRMW